jgi:ribokinase
MPDVVLLGDINIDMIVQIPGYPVRGGEGVATAVEMYTGGSAVNTALLLAQLDVDTGFIGCVGQDALAAQVFTDLAEAGVDHRYVQIDPAVSTGLIFIAVTPGGERTMFASRGANTLTTSSDMWERYFQGARWYHVSGYALLAQPQSEAALFGLELAERQRCRVSIDVGGELAYRHRRQVLELLPRLDIVFPNEDELALLTPSMTTEEGLTHLLEHGVKAVLAKRGKAGCLVATSRDRFELPAFRVQAQDTTGAGDSFNAGVILGRLVGLSWPASAVLGNVFGALATTRKGANAETIRAQQAGLFLEKHLDLPEWRPWLSALEEALAYLEAV